MSCPRALLAGIAILASPTLQAQRPPMDTFTLEVGGQRLHCQRSGKGPDLLLLHGGLSSSEDWDGLRPELEKHFTVLTYDRSGHGRSTDDGKPFTYAAMAEEARGVLDALGIQKIAVTGWSDGGVVGYQLASRWPQRVTRLVAIGANVDVSGLGPETRAWLQKTTTPEALLADLGDVAKAYRRISPNPDRLPSFLVRSRELWLRDPYLPFEDLKRIEAPVLLVVGDRQDVPLAHLQRIHSALKQADPIRVVKGSSHFVLTEKRGDMLQILLSALIPARPFPPIALVNRVSFTDPTFDNNLAGCAFLVRHGNKLYACTCKHALWVAKSSAMKGVHFEGTLKTWRMDRKDDPSQWVKLGRLLNEDRSEAIGPANVMADWLVFEVLENHSDVKPLDVREKPLVPGETLTTLGWTFKDKEGPQRAYRARFHRHLGAKLLMEDLDPPANKAGTSGAPVVDAEGHLVGITSDYTKDPDTGAWYGSPCSVDVLKAILAR